MFEFLIELLNGIFIANGLSADLISVLNFLMKFIISGIYLFIAFLLAKIVKAVAKRTVKNAERSGAVSVRKVKTVSAIIAHALKYIIYFAAICQILILFGMEAASILAFLGVGGVAVGLGFQSFVKDIIQGIFFITEDQFGVGDSIEAGDKSGVVVSMGIRTVRLKDEDGNIHIIPNSSISIVTNKSKTKKSS